MTDDEESESPEEKNQAGKHDPMSEVLILLIALLLILNSIMIIFSTL